MSYSLLINNSYIYIEKYTHMLWWLPNDVQYILFKHTTYIIVRTLFATPGLDDGWT